MLTDDFLNVSIFVRYSKLTIWMYDYKIYRTIDKNILIKVTSKVVWNGEKKSSEVFGTIPVISVSFGSCKGFDYEQAIWGIIYHLYDMYDVHSYLMQSTELTEREKQEYERMKDQFFEGQREGMEKAIGQLCILLYKHHHVKPIILLDEYDTPLVEAYADGYWNEMIGTCRQLFHNAFKENEYYSRAIITGVTKISKNSLFSDMNNIEVYSVTSDAYSDCFGFTEQEVKDALKCQNIDKMSDKKKEKELEDTVANALRQINERYYEADLLNEGIPKKHIYKLGFAFRGKDVLVDEISC